LVINYFVIHVALQRESLRDSFDCCLIAQQGKDLYKDFLDFFDLRDDRLKNLVKVSFLDYHDKAFCDGHVVVRVAITVKSRDVLVNSELLSPLHRANLLFEKLLFVLNKTLQQFFVCVFVGLLLELEVFDFLLV